jgi:hypothetical protein
MYDSLYEVSVQVSVWFKKRVLGYLCLCASVGVFEMDRMWLLFFSGQQEKSSMLVLMKK